MFLSSCATKEINKIYISKGETQIGTIFRSVIPMSFPFVLSHVHINIIDNMIMIAVMTAAVSHWWRQQCLVLWNMTGFLWVRPLHRQSCRPTGLSSSSEQKNGNVNYFENSSDGASERRKADRMEVCWLSSDFTSWKEHVFNKLTLCLMCVKRDSVLLWSHRVYFTKAVMKLWC